MSRRPLFMPLIILAVCISRSLARDTPSLCIHHSPGTRGFRLIWLCEELGVPLSVQQVDFSAAYRQSAEWLEMNPVGKVPVMTDGDFKLFESGAMLQHVLNRYDVENQLEPSPGTEEHALFLQWCWFAEATFGRVTGELASHRRQFETPIEAVLEEMRQRARCCVRALDAALADGRQYLLQCGFSAADVMMGYTILSFERNVGEEPLPENAALYWQRLKARPAFKAAFDANLCQS